MPGCQTQFCGKTPFLSSTASGRAKGPISCCSQLLVIDRGIKALLPDYEHKMSLFRMHRVFIEP